MASTPPAPLGDALSNRHAEFMQLALREARAALDSGEVPVGCVFVEGATGAVLQTGHNLPSATRNATKHAEIVAIDRCFSSTGSTASLHGSTL